MKKRLLWGSISISIVAALLLVAHQQVKQHYPMHIIHSYQEAATELAQATPTTLIVFDVDDTLIASTEFIARGNYFPWWFKLLLAIRFPQLLNNNCWNAVHSLIWTHAPQFLVEPSVPAMIQALQARGITVIALTSMKTGSYGVIPDLPSWRYAVLKKMGIEFSQQYADTTFTQLAPYQGDYPALFHGILCANHTDKGAVLGAFLDYAQITPQTIIYFDDTVLFDQQVGALCAQRHIPCILFNYQGVAVNSTDWSARRVLKQFQHLINDSQWLCNTDQ